MIDLDRLAADQVGHSIFSPSSSARWMRCSGSLVANALVPDKASLEAAEGTVAHSMADQWLRTGQRPSCQEVSQDGYWITVDDAMLAYVEQYVDWVQDCPGEHYFEQKVDVSRLFPIPTGGTADHFACTRGLLTITDLKYGKGVPVYAEENSQAMLYALGVFYEWDWFYDFQQIDIRICQPRLDNLDNWRVSRGELLAFADTVRARAAAAWRRDAARSPGEKQCKFCRVRADCPAFVAWFAECADAEADSVFGTAVLSEHGLRAADMLSGELPLSLAVGLSIDAKARILTMRSVVEKWFADIEASLMAEALDGSVPGWKVVEGRSRRDWKDDDEAEQRMREVGIGEPWTRELLSPNQAEEALHGSSGMPKKRAAGLFESFTTRVPGGLSLVRTDDKREAVNNYGDLLTGASNG